VIEIVSSSLVQGLRGGGAGVAIVSTGSHFPGCVLAVTMGAWQWALGARGPVESMDEA